SLYEQIDPILEVCRHGRIAEAAVQTMQWYQNLLVQPPELTAACAFLVRQSMDAMKAGESASLRQASAGAVLLTNAVARLPGIAAAVDSLLNPPHPPQADADEDCGAGLLDAMQKDSGSLPQANRSAWAPTAPYCGSWANPRSNDD